jgi:hypothetical protein
MKKTLFALFAVLLASFLATCDFFEPPAEEAPPDSTEDGMVRLTINVAGVGRALTTSNAQGAVNYYEVVFKAVDGTLYQVEFGLSASDAARTIIIPPDNYSGAGKAVMFAGNKAGDDYTLLAVGVITATAGGASAGSNANITTSTTGVTFTLSALKNDVNNTATDPGSSTFKIIGPTHAAVTQLNYSTVASDSTGDAIPTATGGGPLYPVFPIPPAGYNPSGDHTDYDNLTENIVGEYSITLPHSASVILQAPWSLDSAAYNGGGTDTGTTIPATELTPKANTTGAALSTVGDPPICTFIFTVDVSSLTPATDDGLCAVSIDVPVYALSPTAKLAATNAVGSTKVWHIRGGTTNATPDGIGGNGGAVILAVGKYYTPP